MQRSWSASSQQEGSTSGETQRAKLQVKALEGQLRDLHSRLTRLQADTRYITLAPLCDSHSLFCAREEPTSPDFASC